MNGKINPQTIDQIRRIAGRRYATQRSRSKILGYQPVSREDTEQIILECFRDDDGRCYYCRRKLTFIPLMWDKHHKSAVSIDHKIPITDDFWRWINNNPIPSDLDRLKNDLKAVGTNPNGIKNLVVCCGFCNIIKGTMWADSYLELVNILRNAGRWEHLSEQMFRGRLADKIERVNIEKTLSKNFGDVND